MNSSPGQRFSPRPLRIVVAGSAGRLGAAVVRQLQRFPEHFQAIAYDRKAMDLLSPARIDDHLRPIAFDALVNCAALTNLDECERHPEAARQINALAVGQMANICQELGARLLHVSTDYVYDGRHPGLRTEADPVAPLGVYARTKLEAEGLVLAADPHFIVARTSWIFGPDRPAFPDQMLAQAKRGQPLEAISDKVSTPSYSADLAEMFGTLLLQPDLGGLFNLCNHGSCSWQEYGQTAIDIAHEFGWLRRRALVQGVPLASRTQFIAPRPVHTAMSPQRYAELTGAHIRPWAQALRSYLSMSYAAAPL